MKIVKISASILLGLALLWHIAVALSAKLSVCGLFMAKPALPGYAWRDTDDANSRFFWQNTDVAWQSGLAHPLYGVETTEIEGKWSPLPGYVLINEGQTLETNWKSGLLHSDYMAWSDDVEGQWIPVTGYKFIYQGDTFVESVWDPNKRYDDLKVMSLTEKDHYQPYAGYTFTEPGKSLNVVWTPGTPNPDNPQLVAGTKEGNWTINSNRTQYATRRRSGITGREVGAFAIGVGTGVVLDRAFFHRW
jgi:hypothetical protein